MIPTEAQAKKLWDKYQLPEYKRRHVELVARTGKYLATKLKTQIASLKINDDLIVAGALLHDIDKNIVKLIGEAHPDTAVRILKEEGLAEVANLVKTHPLHAILDPSIAPKTWEEKILFLADKMVKLEITGVDKRFALWREEHLPQEGERLLDAAYPKVKQLEKEIFEIIKISPADVAKFAKECILI